MSTIQRFLLHGADIESYGFVREEDKKTFFYMFKTFLEAINKLEKDIKIQLLPDSDIMVFVDDESICEFFITADYTTLGCNTYINQTDENLLYIIGIMMLTIKEFNQTLTEASNLFGKKKSKDTVGSNRKFKGLPPGVNKIINKITAMQKSILSDNKKHPFKPKRDI